MQERGWATSQAAVSASQPLQAAASQERCGERCRKPKRDFAGMIRIGERKRNRL